MGKSIIYLFIGIVIFVWGWTSALLLKNFSLYHLSWDISTTEILSITIDVIMAVVIGYILTQRMGNRRVEKDYFINELANINDIIVALENIYSHTDKMQLIEINYAIGKSRKNLNSLWNNLMLSYKNYNKSHKPSYDKIFNNIRILNQQLTDSTYFNNKDNYTPLYIFENEVVLNNTIRPVIDITFNEIRDSIFKMKLEINRL